MQLTPTFHRLDALVKHAQRTARGMRLFNGKASAENSVHIIRSSSLLHLDADRQILVIYTRDYRAAGVPWFKNPELQYCFHLSLALRGPRDKPLPYNAEEGARVVRGFWGDDALRAWVEPAYNPEGQERDIWHYRLFTDEEGKPIVPKGEIGELYRPRGAPKHWRRFSDVHAPRSVGA